MKKLLALLLALVMVLALAACSDTGDTNKSGDDEEKGIVGKWVGVYEMDADTLGLDGFEESVDLTFIMDFDKDGTCVMTIDMDAMEDTMDDLSKDLVDYMVDMLYDELGKDEADEYCEEEFGMSCKEYCEDFVTELVDEMMAEFEDLEEEGEYTYEDGVLELDGEELDCTIKGDKMTIEGTSELIGIEDEKLTLKRA